MKVERNGQYHLPWPARVFWVLAAVTFLIIAGSGVWLYKQYEETAVFIVLPWFMVPLGFSAIAAVIDLLGGIQYQVQRLAERGPVKVKVEREPAKKAPAKSNSINVPADLRAMQERFGYKDSWWITDMEDEFLVEEPLCLDDAVSHGRSKSMTKIRLVNEETPQEWHTVKI